MSTDRLYRLAGLSALIAGICYLVIGLFHPANVSSAVTTTRWEVVHVFACAMSFFGMIGMTGLYVRQASRTGWVALVGYVCFTLWLTLVMGYSLIEAAVLPKIADSTPQFVTAWMDMFSGTSNSFDMGALPTIWMISGPLYMLGGLLFGIATFRAGVFPRWAGALLALGTLLAPTAALLPDSTQPRIAIPVGAALAWLGYALWQERRVSLSIQEASTAKSPTAVPPR